MKKIAQSCFLALLIITIYVPLSICEQSELNKIRIENLRAFTKLYGYVKYFHPSDEASEIDWDKFALYGTESVLKVKTREELKSCLLKLFLPVAPTMQLLSTGENPKPYKNPEKIDGLLPVVWQYSGLGISTDSIYKSRRTNRLPVEDFSDSISNYIPLQKSNYRKIKLSARMKAEVRGTKNFGNLMLMLYDSKTFSTITSKSLIDSPVNQNEWKLYEIELDIPSKPFNYIVIKAYLSGTGKVWIDDLKMTAIDNSDKEENIAIENPGFEELDEKGYPKKWADDLSFSHDFKSAESDSFEGKRSMMIMNAPERIPGPLFEYMPKPGELIQKDIGADLRCVIPIFLWSDEYHTLGPQAGNTLMELKNSLSKISLEDFSIDNESHRVANIAISWNIFQHFYPYFDIVKVDWDDVLTHSIERAFESKTDDDYQKTLRWMIAQLKDGHGRVIKLTDQKSLLPFWAEWIEGKLVITTSKEPDKFRKGDIILEINGTPTEKYYQEESQYLSGSDRWKRYSFTNPTLIQGNEGTEIKLRLDRDGSIIDSAAVYNNKEMPPNREIELVFELEKDIWYIDLNRAEWDQIEPKIESIINSKGVIFDLRGYPANFKFLGYLSNVPMQSAIWRIPQIIYPDRENLVNWDESGRWWIIPEKNIIKGKIVFLTNAHAISAAETILGIIEYYKVAEIIGEPTAGTNGNNNYFSLPGKYQILWTGMRVEKHDRSQHHLIGIQPTIPCSKTIKGVREGKDEILEKALEVIKSYQTSSDKKEQ
jgi:C-terminal processing protease CtpA/Prc